MSLIDELKFDDKGLVGVIIQDACTNEVLTLAYMSRDAVEKTLQTGHTWFWRRSHQKLMMKGETSGNVQVVKEIRTDCDKDALVVKIEQIGEAACHEGYRSCFFYQVNDGGEVVVDGDRIYDPKDK
ncbi:MAG: phosphoribosyl-AMP cyclohydrolase [Armatimonadetes bacterium CG07_land_8_20_14_0_80_59_28]|nr:MAG: phosphoribosyl-AMP cyclohydrolase [Armatimonadetes bacterium CG07_land_8_20_14_0_80_59_28]